MTILTFIIAIFIIAVLFWAINTYIPAVPQPLLILRWTLNVLLIVILFLILFNLIGWVDMGATLNHPVTN